MDVLEALVKASYARDKTALLVNANEGIEMTRWIIRMAHDRTAGPQAVRVQRPATQRVRPDGGRLSVVELCSTNVVA